jgi:hypothetical protein
MPIELLTTINDGNILPRMFEILLSQGWQVTSSFLYKALAEAKQPGIWIPILADFYPRVFVRSQEDEKSAQAARTPYNVKINLVIQNILPITTTPLHILVQNPNATWEDVDAIINLGAKIDALDSQGRTVLDVSGEHLEFYIRLLSVYRYRLPTDINELIYDYYA